MIYMYIYIYKQVYVCVYVYKNTLVCIPEYLRDFWRQFRFNVGQVLIDNSFRPSLSSIK